MTKRKSASTRWKLRIVGTGTVAPDQLLAHPLNWRVHPHTQERALEAVLDEIGWVKRVLVNRRTGHVIDGHLRVALALQREEVSVPVEYVDVSETEERALLVTLDPLVGLAGPDKAKLAGLLADVRESASATLQQLLSALAPVSLGAGRDLSADLKPTYAVLVECVSERQQTKLLQRFSGEGLTCRALVS